VQIRALDGRLVRSVEYAAGRSTVEGLRPGVYLAGREPFAIP